MKKSYFIALVALLLGGGMQAQQFTQKIGDNPYKLSHPDAVLEVESTNKGILLPRVALTATTSPAPLSAHVAGMMVYNTATAGDVTPGRYTNNGTAWVKNEATKTVGQNVVSDCTANGFSTVNLVKGAASSGLNFTVSLTNNTLSSAGPLNFAVGDLVLSGANAGLTVSAASPATATITPGLSQVVTYTITGTPTDSGVLTGKWEKLSLSCENTRNVDGNLVAALNCASATFNTAFTDNTTSYWTKMVLPYTGGNGGDYTIQTFSSTGVTGMTATLAAGKLNVGAGNLTLTISGTPSANGNADFSITFGGKTCTVSMPVMSFSTNGNGSTAALTSRSCNAIKLANASAADGLYFIDIDGVDNTYSAQEAYCNMTLNGGGWTLISQWGAATTATTVASLTSPSNTGQLGTNYIKKLASFSDNVRLELGSSPSNITADAVSTTATPVQGLRLGSGMGPISNFTLTGTWPVIPTYVNPGCGSAPWAENGCAHRLGSCFQQTPDQVLAVGFLATDKYIYDWSNRAQWIYRDGRTGVCQDFFTGGWITVPGQSGTITWFDVGFPGASTYRAAWLK